MKHIFKSNNRFAAFTLIEIMTVVAIIGILATIMAGPISLARKKGRDTQRKSDLLVLSQAIDLYLTQKRVVPDPTIQNQGSNCKLTSEGTEPWIPGLTDQFRPITSRGGSLPVDPLQQTGRDGFVYTYISYQHCASVRSGTKNYRLMAKLEYQNDPDAVEVGGVKMYVIER